MRVAVDTNVLVRAVVCDDPAQASVAAKVLIDAELLKQQSHEIGKRLRELGSAGKR